MKTFDRATFEQAERAWSEGMFGAAWEPFRQAAAARGFIYPPAGSRHDDREDDNPSQRAIVWRAIEDNPTRLAEIIGHSSNWAEVVRGIIGLEARLREDYAVSEVDEEAALWEKRQGRRTDALALQRLLGGDVAKLQAIRLAAEAVIRVWRQPDFDTAALQASLEALEGTLR